MIQSVNHVAIYVKNREEAIDFYREILGAELIFTLDNESDGILIAMMQLGNMKIELLEPPEGKEEMAPAAANTLNHFAVNVDDIEEAVNYIREKGFVFEDRIIYDVPHFGSPNLDLKVAFFRGPNGERIELVQEFYK